MANGHGEHFDIKLPAVPAVAEPSLFKELLTLYNSIKLLENSVLRRNSLFVHFYETAGNGAIMSFMDDGSGIAKVRLAQHGVYEAHCFATGTTVAGTVGEVCIQGFRLAQGAALPVGQKYWLSSTPGLFSTSAPGAGAQRVGFAISPTELWFDPELLA